MMLYQNFDLLLRKIISLFYRVLLVAFSASVLIRNPNVFEWYIYAGIIAIYLIIFGLLYNKDGFLSLLRLFVDFVFIYFILFKKDINNFHSITLIFLPLINSVNHSSNTRSKLSPFVLYILTFLLIFLLRELKFVWGDLVALFAIWIVNIFLYTRHYLVRIFNTIDEIINGFYMEKIEIGKQYRLLRSVRDVLNSNKKFFFLLHRPIDITIFAFREGKFSVISSTNFFVKYKFDDERSFVKEITKKNRLRNVRLSLDDGPTFPNIVLRVPSEDMIYFYVVSIFEISELNLKDYASSRIYAQVFQKITNVLQIERSIAIEKKEYLHGIKMKMVFVDSTIKSIHFLNNRLTPISNYFDLLKLSEAETDQEKRQRLETLLEIEKRNAMNSIDPIIFRMRTQLEKANNPYIISSIERIGIQKLYSMVRKCWEDSNLLHQDISMRCSKSFLAREVVLNVESFEFLLDEILNNIIKHANRFHKVEIIEENDFICFRFINDIKDFNKNIDWLNKIITYFNSDEINEIIKKTSYGLSFMKESLKQMNIFHEMSITEDKKVILLLKINTENKNEASIV
ncbi:MAG: hypothetical protein K0S33_3801 [Bacteroidetes bacterium]|jgi:hypothetical protein|nr:hypothetical protein [Bacteroidota bacterium]